MKLCRFYSPDWLSSLLVEVLPDLAPNTIVDLGSGPGSLTAAVAARWPASRITTVDLDADVSAAQPEEELCRYHLRRNVLADGLARAIGVDAGTIDLVISNPPYTRVPRNRSVSRVLNRAGLGDAVAAWSSIPVDLAFLAQALLLTRPGGTVAFVVPDTFISSEVMKAARRLVLTQHHVETVIQLPRGTFGGTDAQAFIMVIQKGRPCGTINLRTVDNSGRPQFAVEIDATDGILRLDCRFHVTSVATSDRARLADLGVVVARGRSSSRDVAAAPDTIFHTSNFPKEAGESISLKTGGAQSVSLSGVIAEAGDILLARVDRRLESKVAIVRDGTAAISDCVLSTLR